MQARLDRAAEDREAIDRYEAAIKRRAAEDVTESSPSPTGYSAGVSPNGVYRGAGPGFWHGWELKAALPP